SAGSSSAACDAPLEPSKREHPGATASARSVPTPTSDPMRLAIRRIMFPHADDRTSNGMTSENVRGHSHIASRHEIGHLIELSRRDVPPRLVLGPRYDRRHAASKTNAKFAQDNVRIERP